MLAWTPAGAVALPRTLQLRLQRSYPGRIRAGAPVPTRSMSEEEATANLRYFTRSGPRVIPIEALVLSGVGVATRPDLPALVAVARELGVRGITLHVGAEDLDALATAPLPSVSRVVIPLEPGSSGSQLAAGGKILARARAEGVEVSVNTTLTPTSIPALPAIARVAIAGGVKGITFTWPFPIEGGNATEVAAPRQAVRALEEVIPEVEAAGLRAVVKGLPGCYLGALARCADKTQNRWYVDADHQQEQALLFFPDVVAFHKEDACRFCALDGRCDGFFATYLRRPGFPPLTPVPSGDAGGAR